MSVKLANWMAGVVLPILLAAGCVLDQAASSRTLALAEGPVELWRETDAGAERRAAAAGLGEGVPFGYRVRYDLGDHGEVDCIGRFARYRCADGWRLVAASAAP